MASNSNTGSDTMAESPTQSQRNEAGTGRDTGPDKGKSQPGNGSFLQSTQQVIGDAFDATVTAVRENPVTSAAIAAGAAAAIGGAAYAATQLRANRNEPHDD